MPLFGQDVVFTMVYTIYTICMVHTWFTPGSHFINKCDIMSKCQHELCRFHGRFEFIQNAYVCENAFTHKTINVSFECVNRLFCENS